MNHNELSSIRDTVQSIWVAIILAFVLRAFMLEAFEIPTGSMAPQLMGRHTLVTCPDCGYSFPRGSDKSGSDVWAVCPNCRMWINRTRYPDLGGDRVLVFKLPQPMRDVQRWDVVVFKDVQANRENFIKRLVGLPGEVLRIVHGDVFTHPITDRDGDGDRDEDDLDVDDPVELTDWKIARKPHATQATMWQLLFDNDYQPANSRARRSPWKPLWVKADASDDRWDLTGNHGRVFRYAGETPGALRFAPGAAGLFEATNAYNGPERNDEPYKLNRRNALDNRNLCSDLRLETMIVPAGDGAVRLTTSHFDHEFAAEFNFDGRVRLLHRRLDADGTPDRSWEAADVWGDVTLGDVFTSDKPATVALTHADWRVTVWVNAEAVLDSRDDPYSPDIAMIVAAEEARAVPVPRVGITGLHGTFALRHLRVFRDVFYTSPDLALPEDMGDPTVTYFLEHERAALARKHGWGTTANPITLRSFADRPDYDEFFMLGDNSPASADSRRWTQAAPTLRLYDKTPQTGERKPLYRMGTVPRYQLIGKAFFVYWPAGNRLPLPGLDRLPIVPHVGKMRRIE